MKKIIKVILSIIGGMDVFITVSTPIILVLVYLALFGIEKHWTTYLFIIVGCGASFFRGIKSLLKVKND